eukprot:CAMPEP_0181436392 /NCGR_PEP_ID=MMETSP1110-20121109/20827_1 /TAXON_ID=174948 /ORGANISM="Symbiodinium sp., Strain CCMP421" /LENGTH=97 /DNA_ID=CAMNT_0023559961 /DNA_START=30 /DNA_END=320 /DNA_ORIENTATION=+
MAPASSRLLGTGVALGLAGAFVAPSGRPATQNRAPAEQRPATGTTSAGTTGTLATLAAVSVSLAAFGRGRTQVKSAEVSDLPPPLFQPSEQFGATEP